MINVLFLALSVLAVLTFLLSYCRQPAKLINGSLFILMMGTLGATLMLYAWQTQNQIILAILGAILLTIGMIFIFGSIILILACFVNFIVLIKREGFRKSYLLVLALGIFALVANILGYLQERSVFTRNADIFIAYANTLVLYGLFVSLNFLVSSFLCRLYHPRHNKDYIIVLGAGLIDGVRVSKLLANRLDKAIAFYDKQRTKNRKPPKLLLSGGKGGDEILSEAFAMQTYALEKGIPIEDTILEENSTTTYENMLFSKKIIQTRSKDQKCKVIYSTNNFHLLRAGIFARQVGLNAPGISAKTAAYYYPNALIREFIATLFINKKRHFIATGLLFILSLATYLINRYLTT
ncbi:uncharacterized SAM-binding protein YcdF (DUF218 family) [Lachnospiraceae bacterium PFB1-21]